MKEDPKENGRHLPNLLLVTDQLVQELRSVYPHSKLPSLAAWFPDLTRQRVIAEADPDNIAAFTAQSLGHVAAWEDAIRYLSIYRPQDGGTAAGDLGLTQDEAGYLSPLDKQISMAWEAYTNYLIEDLLKGDLTLVATKLQTAGQAVGFYTNIFSRSRKVQKEVNTRIRFVDTSEELNSMDGIFFLLDELPRETMISSPNYNQDANILSFDLASRF